MPSLSGERYGLLDKLHGKYANFRRYFRSFVDLPFAAESVANLFWTIWRFYDNSTGVN